MMFKWLYNLTKPINTPSPIDPRPHNPIDHDPWICEDCLTNRCTSLVYDPNCPCCQEHDPDACPECGSINLTGAPHQCPSM